MGWEVKEGFLEELTWSAMGGNLSGKNNEAHYSSGGGCCCIMRHLIFFLYSLSTF